MRTRSQKIELVLELGSLEAALFSSRVLPIICDSNEIVKIFGKSVSANEIPALVKSTRKHSFSIETSRGYLHFSTVTAYGINIIEAREKSGDTNFQWDSIAEQVFGEVGFVQGYVADYEYSRWQDARDPLQYEAAGREYAGLPMISNGLPKPLEKMVIDVSGNPSRRIMRIGYIEAIGHTQWFGRKFWRLVGEWRREKVFELESCRVISLNDGVIRVDALSGPFVDDAKRLDQKRLRHVLFEQANQE